MATRKRTITHPSGMITEKCRNAEEYRQRIAELYDAYIPYAGDPRTYEITYDPNFVKNE